MPVVVVWQHAGVELGVIIIRFSGGGDGYREPLAGVVPALGNLVYSPGVAVRKGILGEGVEAPVRAVRTVGYTVLEPGMAVAGMVDYIVQIDADVPGMCGFDQVAEVFLLAEAWIDVLIIYDVVAMV